MCDRLPPAEERILVVEDMYLVADEIVKMVREAGCEPVGPFAHVQDALAALDDDDVHIVGALLDINLGNETAYPIASELNRRQIPFIFLTGYGSSGVDPAFSGAPTLSKPFTRKQLHEAMSQRLLHHPAEQI